MLKQQTSQRLWLVAILSIAILLTACGAGEAPKKPLTDSDYKLEMAGQVPAGEFTPPSVLWVRLVTAITTDLRTTLDWYVPSSPVAADGSYEISVDAREIMGEAIGPKLFGEWYLVPTAAEVSDISATDPAAELRVMDDIFLYQTSPTEVDLVHTHYLSFWQKQVVGGTPIAEWIRPVFSDRDVRIQGSTGAPASTPRVTVDMDLKAGWNFVYAIPGSRASATTEYVARPILATDISELTPVTP